MRFNPGHKFVRFSGYEILGKTSTQFVIRTKDESPDKSIPDFIFRHPKLRGIACFSAKLGVIAPDPGCTKAMVFERLRAWSLAFISGRCRAVCPSQPTPGSSSLAFLTGRASATRSRKFQQHVMSGDRNAPRSQDEKSVVRKRVIHMMFIVARIKDHKLYRSGLALGRQNSM
jgi:hypothetical protein